MFAKNKKRVNFIMLALTMMLSYIYCIFNHIDWSAKAVGVGVGYVGCGDVDSSIVMWNPAGMVYIESPNELSGMYGMPFMGLATGIDLRYSMISFGRKIDNKQSIGAGIGMFDGAGVWRESVYVVGYSRALDKLSLGLALKYLDYKVNLEASEYGDDPLLAKGGKSVISGDIGGVYNLSNNLKLGLVVKDVASPDISLSESGEKLEMSYFVGVNYITTGDTKMIYSLGYYGSASESGYSLGAEVFLSGGRIILRGSYSDVRYALGASYNLEKLRLDYTYAIPSQLTDTQGSHYVGLVFRF